MKLKVCPLASGSSGNAIYIGDEKNGFLIDSGLSGSELERRLQSIDCRCEDLDGIILTHEHIDHARGVGVLSRRFSLPVYTRPGTWYAGEKILGPINSGLQRELVNGLSFGQFDVEYFNLPHDAQEHVGLNIHWQGRRVIVATDLGEPTTELREFLPKADIIVLEANHDIAMLENGPYPGYLKKRIAGSRGHLSNDVCGELLADSLGEKPTKVFLAHLSRENNAPQVARLTIENYLQYRGVQSDAEIQISVAKRDCASDIFEVS